MLELKLKLKSLEFQLSHFTNPRVLKCVFPGQRFIGGMAEIMEMIGMKTSRSTYSSIRAA